MGNSTQQSEVTAGTPSPERLGSQVDGDNTEDRLKSLRIKQWLKIAKANCSSSFTTELDDLIAWCDLQIKKFDGANT